jgi:ABC-type lipoprotein export system ATPase subunit
MSSPVPVETSSTPAIVAVNLTRRFTLGGRTITAVDGASFCCSFGQLVAISGPSGSGKSTLLSLLGGLETPSAGTVHVDGIDVGALPGHEADQYRRQKVGFVFQTFNLIPNLSALENVMLPMELAGTSLPIRRDRAHALLQSVGMQERERHRPGKLSGGEQQRVAVARALANDPSIILADEPTGNLDWRTGAHIVGLLQDLAHQGRTVVVVTHDLSIAAKADRHLELVDGRIILEEVAEKSHAYGC